MNMGIWFVFILCCDKLFVNTFFHVLTICFEAYKILTRINSYLSRRISINYLSFPSRLKEIILSHGCDVFQEGGTDESLFIEVAAGMPAEELNLLNKLKPDLYCGHLGANGWVTRLGIPNLPLFGQSLNYMGYQGALELARRADKALRNVNFARNIAKNTSLPLSRSWMESDVRSNIKESESA